MKPRWFACVLWLVCTLPAPAYVLLLNDGRFAEHWNLLTPQAGVSTNVVNTNTHAIRFFLASDGYSTTNTAAELNALRASFGQWQSISGTYLKFEDAGLVGPQTDVNGADGKNIIFWTRTNQYLVNGGLDSISGALGLTYGNFTVDDNTLVEADIVFNGAEKAWFTDFNDTANTNIFIEGVALHELGHFIGLEHSPVGGATMLYHGGSGVSVQAGLSSDEIAAVRFLYPVGATNYGSVKGTVTKSGSPVFGAAVFAETSTSNVVAGTVTFGNGDYEINRLPPGTYQIRVAPLDPFSGTRLVMGYDIGNSPDSTNTDFTAADTVFLPTTNVTTVVAANTTNTVNFAVIPATPAFRITHIRTPTTVAGAYSISSLPVSLRVGQSNYFVTVFSASLPTSAATFTISGDGLTLGSPTYQPGTVFVGLNGITMTVSISSNATPGLRDFIVTQGTNIAYANGFFEVLGTKTDYNFDGLEDTFQRQYFAPFTSAAAAPGADPDGDGMNNASEYIAGTNPTDAASVLKMVSVSRTNTTNTVRWQSVTGKKYQAFYRTNIASGSWSNLGSVVTAAGTTSLQTDPTATNTYRFYRVQVLP